ncbi:MAG: DUF3109 family protein [Saprospiraceae bacterium]
MFIIQEILISDDVVEKQFLCNLSACKGACCWEGDFGAPLEKEEIELLEKDYESIKPFLSEEGKAVIEKEGKYTWFEEPKENGTPLIKGAACAYMTYNELGIAQCGIEQAHKAGVTDFYKPISCHLYPIRINKEEELGFEAMNYDKWDICSAACELGKKEQLPVYQFVKNAIIRKYGKDFYDELDAAVKYSKRT